MIRQDYLVNHFFYSSSNRTSFVKRKSEADHDPRIKYHPSSQTKNEWEVSKWDSLVQFLTGEPQVMKKT
ncbi:hypothetical protein GCM10020331_058870 [Ectobacillus funiculus]